MLFLEGISFTQSSAILRLIGCKGGRLDKSSSILFYSTAWTRRLLLQKISDLNPTSTGYSGRDITDFKDGILHSASKKAFELCYGDDIFCIRERLKR